MAYGKRQNPAKKAEERMTRADSLQSIQKYGKVVPPSKVKTAEFKVGRDERPSILGKIKDALKRKK